MERYKWKDIEIKLLKEAIAAHIPATTIAAKYKGFRTVSAVRAMYAKQKIKYDLRKLESHEEWLTCISEHRKIIALKNKESNFDKIWKAIDKEQENEEEEYKKSREEVRALIAQLGEEKLLEIYNILA